MQILKMVQEGKVTAEEAAKLLQAVDAKPANTTSTSSIGARWLRVRVQEAGRQVVNVNLPMTIVEVALSMGVKFIPQEHLKDIDLNALLDAVKQGLTGKIVEVDDGDSKVEIIIE
ncbi:MAG: hypothetical protein FD169_1449 [Bacillota bacterium]|nr:MAG: hypothetical protein FD169_1449 [Bacillota bacterium]